MDSNIDRQNVCFQSVTELDTDTSGRRADELVDYKEAAEQTEGGAIMNQRDDLHHDSRGKRVLTAAQEAMFAACLDITHGRNLDTQLVVLDSLFVTDVFDDWIDFLQADDPGGVIDNGNAVPRTDRVRQTYDSIKKLGFAGAGSGLQDEPGFLKDLATIVDDPALLVSLQFEILGAPTVSLHWSKQLLAAGRIPEIRSLVVNERGLVPVADGENNGTPPRVAHATIENGRLSMVITGLGKHTSPPRFTCAFVPADDEKLDLLPSNNGSPKDLEPGIQVPDRNWTDQLEELAGGMSRIVKCNIENGEIRCTFDGVQGAADVARSVLVIVSHEPTA